MKKCKKGVIEEKILKSKEVNKWNITKYLGKSNEEIYKILKTDSNGLSAKEANRRLEENG